MPWATTRVRSIVYWPSTVFTSCITSSVSLGTQPSALPDFGPITMKWLSSQISRKILAIFSPSLPPWPAPWNHTISPCDLFGVVVVRHVHPVLAAERSLVAR